MLISHSHKIQTINTELNFINEFYKILHESRQKVKILYDLQYDC